MDQTSIFKSLAKKKKKRVWQALTCHCMSFFTVIELRSNSIQSYFLNHSKWTKVWFPTVQCRELSLVLCGDLDGWDRCVWRQWGAGSKRERTYVYIYLLPLCYTAKISTTL